MDEATRPLLTATDVRRLLDGAGHAARRSLGQNFVVDPNTIRRIVSLARVEPGDRVLEIGPGLGSLTLGLLEAGTSVVAIEKDRRLASLLREVVGPSVEIVEGDALDVDLPRIVGDEPTAVIANLPYNVATPLVLRVLDDVAAVDRMLVMVQKEVGERLVARPATGAYGIPSLRVAFHADAELVGSVSPTVFHPRPRVTSALVLVRRLPAPRVEVADPDRMWRLVRVAFGQRRKTLRRSLTGLVDEAAFDAAGIDPAERPERLGLAEFAALADAGSPS
ncbi:MAG TPA: 16S rRNA (adenine(1518)-N(6)/adenine(1519)-N(6))-dimethyltransferase RsmA [Microthrixaceae bacterium]|nr:16S rRNA (adenine(1518)-N(6)/adenine(1519)-N(6))-dimethyltransferase RsmA [Microthrixaceae bacterium]